MTSRIAQRSGLYSLPLLSANATLDISFSNSSIAAVTCTLLLAGTISSQTRQRDDGRAGVDDLRARGGILRLDEVAGEALHLTRDVPREAVMERMVTISLDDLRSWLATCA